jgi:integrase
MGIWRMAKFRMRKILPKLIVKHKTVSAKELKELLLLEYNVERTEKAFTMFMQRNPELIEECKKKIGIDDAKHETIRYDFDYWINKENRSQIPVIQNWIDTMIARKVSNKVIRVHVGRLRHICMGTKARKKKGAGKGKSIQLVDWKIHPLALTEDKAQKYLAELIRNGFPDFGFRLTIRNFLKFGKGKIPTKIGGDKPQSKYAYINLSKEERTQILEFIRERSYLCFAHVSFLRKTGTRAEASKVGFGAFNKDRRTIIVEDKGKKREKYIWQKYVDEELLYILEPLLEQKKLFEDLDPDQSQTLCREAYQKFISNPKILAYAMKRPLHLWRHDFAQRMLDATEWNYAIVAKLGGWKSDETLKNNYGEPPPDKVANLAIKYIPLI